jgi:Protein of unknown function (DUF2946)
MGSLRISARVKGWLGIVAVLSNLLAGVLCMAPGLLGAAGDVPGQVLLCTEHGPQLVAVDGPAGGSGQDQRDGKSSHCTACTLLAGAVLLATFLFTAIAFQAGIFRPLHCHAHTLADHLRLGGIRSRAPPLFA